MPKSMQANISQREQTPINSPPVAMGEVDRHPKMSTGNYRPFKDSNEGMSQENKLQNFTPSPHRKSTLPHIENNNYMSFQAKEAAERARR
jgi:hypothetical protein